MDTRWKNRMKLAVWLLLFTFGLSGLALGMSSGQDYINKDYFGTAEFQGQLDQFVNYLAVFELNYISEEQAKNAMTVTKEEIEEHRYRYGDLSEQIANIKEQYDNKIQDALIKKNKEAADFYTGERDKKIEDITNNFRSDDYVRVKVLKEKEEKLDTYFRELEKYRSEFLKYKGAFRYNLKETTTGQVYSNLATGNDADGGNGKAMLFIQSYPSSASGYLSTENRNIFLNGEIQPETLINSKAKVFEGYIGVPKSGVAASPIMADYYDFQQKQKFFFIYVTIGILAFILSLYFYHKLPVAEFMDNDKYRRLYNRIPIDIGFFGFALIGLTALILVLNSQPMYLHEYLYTFFKRVIFNLIVTSFFVALTFIQGKLLLDRVKDRQNLKTLWQGSLLYKANNCIQRAFLNRSVGAQIFILLGIIYAFGAGFGLIVAEPRIIVLYAPLAVIIGLPIIIVIVKRIGYFNLIVNHVAELVRGNFEFNLPVKGKSVLAQLAENINTLKYGVKLSQKEQVKSERLKTELITNVSHDLRTPLTSIITYTELLRTPDLTDEDRKAYIEIIDSKSKRLKVLIDDLFEASKMASGNIELVKEKVDLVQLLQQALAEHNETISQSTLQFRVTNPEQPVYAAVDGQKLWRVFDNLIGNILKYSLENTRVFISIKTLPGKAVIMFKNITKYELGENIDELFERFRRGDTSRHTEGSGLGLAIAKSIVDLHGGSLDIDVDGDLFKITVTLNAMVD